MITAQHYFQNLPPYPACMTWFYKVERAADLATRANEADADGCPISAETLRGWALYEMAQAAVAANAGR